MNFASHGETGDNCTVQLDITGTTQGGFAIQKGSNVTIFNSEPLNVTQVSPDAPGLVPLSVSPSPMVLTPGGAQFLYVNNESSTDTAYDVNVYIPGELQNQISVVANDGTTIPPTGTISFSIIALDNAIFSTVTIPVLGSNTVALFRR
jgi:hypothetical protein